MKFYKSNCVIRIVERSYRIEMGELFTKAEIAKYRLNRFNFNIVDVSSHDCIRKNKCRFQKETK